MQPRRLRLTKPGRSRNSRHMRHLYVLSNQPGSLGLTRILILCSTQETPKASRLPWTRTQTSNWPRSLNNSTRIRTQWSRSCSIGSFLSSQNYIATSRRSRHKLLVGHRFHDTPITFMSCNVLITPNETHPHDTLRVYRSMDSGRDHRHKETSTTLHPLGDVRGGKLASRKR